MISLTGWPRRITALFLGSMTVLALPPFHVWPLLIPGFVGLAWLIDGCRTSKEPRCLTISRLASWSAFSIGWWFGVGFFSAGLYWLSLSFLVDAATFAWMIPFALFGISASMALYIGLTGWLAYVSSQGSVSCGLFLARGWVIFEWIRGWAFSGFPWNLLGTVWTISDAMIQLTAVTGVFGLSLVTVLAAVAPSTLGNKNIKVSKRYALTSIAWVALSMVWVGGYIRLNDAIQNDVNSVRLRLVQPNIDQRDKWKPHLQKHHFDTLLRLSKHWDNTNTTAPTHIIWPETATPIYLSSSKETLKLVSIAAPSGGALLTGAPRQTSPSVGPNEIWNSIHVIDSSAQIIATYDKFHLVPFGEYIPFRRFFDFPSLTGGRTDFSPGPGPKILIVPGAPSVMPLICYEAIFPAQIGHYKDQPRPGWLLNLTNDAWFGSSSGPYQHFAAARLRAVEEGLPLIRVANTGLSGVIDSYGRIRIQTNLNEQVAVESHLPASLSGLTWFARHGNTTVFLIIVMLFCIFRLKFFSAEK